jgi:hypothetical protein
MKPPRFLVSGLLAVLASCISVHAAPPDQDATLAALIAANDGEVSASLDKSPSGGFRGIGAQAMTAAAAYTTAQSRLYHDARLVPVLDRLVSALLASQRADGLFDVGNLDSPPDSAFILKTLARAQFFLERDNQPATAAVRAKLKTLILQAAEGVRQGGVHTPNHRWAICSALAQVHQLYPNPAYVARIDDWLGEGLDSNSEGEWAERSPNYTAHVNNPSILEVAVLLQRPELLEPIRRNLEMTLAYIEVNGELETVQSRRQDQAQRARKYIWEYYVPYRYLAGVDQNPRFAAVVRRIERDFLAELGADATNMSSALVAHLQFAAMAKPMPTAADLPDSYAKVFAQSGLARIRRGNVTASIFGGNDWHLGLGVGSGLSTNPAFFKFRKGAAVLDSVRFSPGFFNTGFFYPQSLTVTGPNEYQLVQVLQVPYHLPLPAAHRRADGSYRHTGEGRFFSKMDFPNRPKDFKTLTTRVTVRENHGAFDLVFDVDGFAGVPVILELCFRKDGTLAGVEKPAASEGGRGGGGRAGPAMENDQDSFVLKGGQGSYTVGSDRIEFGPGASAHNRLRMEGENYSVYNGHNRAEGYRVYLTGVTPFKHTLTVK